MDKMAGLAVADLAARLDRSGRKVHIPMQSTVEMRPRLTIRACLHMEIAQSTAFESGQSSPTPRLGSLDGKNLLEGP